MGYETAPATQMLATNCLICDRPLVDAASVEFGVGPVCRRKHGFDDDVPNREEANAAVYAAACAAQQGDVPTVLSLADTIEEYGLTTLATKVRERFIHIRLVEDEDGWVQVFTPYNADFVSALHRNVPRDGKRKVTDPEKRNNRGLPRFKCWEISRDHSRGLLAALSQAYAGDYAVGPKGVFTIPYPS